MIDNIKTGGRIKEYMKVSGLSAKDVQEALHLDSVQSVYYWIRGRNLPSLENLYALSVLFKVPMEQIIVGNKEPYYV